MKDSTNLSIILGIFGLLLYYLIMTNQKINVLEASDKKCDPVNLFLNSLNENVEDSITRFKTCVNKI